MSPKVTNRGSDDGAGVKQAEGYLKIPVNGEVTMDDGKQASAPSGRLLRYGA